MGRFQSQYVEQDKAVTLQELVLLLLLFCVGDRVQVWSLSTAERPLFGSQRAPVYFLLIPPESGSESKCRASDGPGRLSGV